MHGKSMGPSSAFVTPRGLIGASSSSSAVLTKDGKRVSQVGQQPLEMMFTGFEGEAFGFLKDVITAGATGGTGDVIAQFAEKKSADQQTDPEGKINFFEEPFELDTRRSLSYAGFAAAYTGGFQHFLFSGLNDAIPDPMVRVAVNQGLIIPLCYYSILVVLVPKLRARSKVEEDELRGSINVKKMIPRNWLFWVPLQFIQFNFIPMDFQVIYCSFCGLIWNIALSLLTAGGAEKEPVPMQPESAMVAGDATISDVRISIPAGEGTTRSTFGGGILRNRGSQSANSAKISDSSNTKTASTTANK